VIASFLLNTHSLDPLAVFGGMYCIFGEIGEKENGRMGNVGGCEMGVSLGRRGQ